MTTPMLLLSPSLLDQSFPKTNDELKRVSIALGEIDGFLRTEDIVLVNIDIFSLFVEEFYWEKAEIHSQLIDIVTVLSEWLLRSPSFVKTVCLDEVPANQSHPLPSSVASSECVTIWAEQTAKLLTVHDLANEGERFFLGIACERAFASEKIGQLENPRNFGSPL